MARTKLRTILEIVGASCIVLAVSSVLILKSLFPESDLGSAWGGKIVYGQYFLLMNNQSYKVVSGSEWYVNLFVVPAFLLVFLATMVSMAYFAIRYAILPAVNRMKSGGGPL